MARRIFQIKELPRAMVKAWLVICIASMFLGGLGMLHDFFVYSNQENLAPLSSLGALGFFLQHAFPMDSGKNFRYDFTHVLIMAVLWAAMTTKWTPSKTELSDEKVDLKLKMRKANKTKTL